MADQINPSDPTPESRVLGVRWEIAEIDRMEMAAGLLTEREHFRVTVTDVIRRGTRREVDAILAQAEAESEAAS